MRRFYIQIPTPISVPLPQARPCVIAYEFALSFWSLFGCVNRAMTFYVTFVRARAVNAVRYAMRVRNKTGACVVAEIIVFSLLGGILCMGIFVAMLNMMTYPEAMFVSHSFSALFVAFLAIVTLLALRRRLTAVEEISHPKGDRGSVDEFQRLVALVALVFCCCQLVCAIVWLLVDAIEENVTLVTKQLLWTEFAAVLNSTVNLFVYIAASSEFRKAFMNFIRCRKITTG